MAPDNLTDSIAVLRTAACEHYAQGRFLEAVKSQASLVNSLYQAGQSNNLESKQLAVYLHALGEHSSAAVVLRELAQHMPDDVDICEHLGVVLLKSGKPQEALSEFQRALAARPERINVHDGLAHTYGKLGDMDQCRKHGETSLRLKDELAINSGTVYAIPEEPPKPFRFDEPEKNIIAFSLFGSNQRYLQGALRNATLGPDIYPGWRCRFYCDESVPDELRERLRNLDAEIVMMPRPAFFYEGLFWRFFVASDPEVSRFLVRDCDSVINVKERVAVDQWLASNRYFHVMRDFYSHTELIHAGMWGGVGGVLPPVRKLVSKFLSKALLANTVDQIFLREQVWPTVRQSCMIHDSLFRVLGSRKFPGVGDLGPNRHIGQNDSVHRRTGPPGS